MLDLKSPPDPNPACPVCDKVACTAHGDPLGQRYVYSYCRLAAAVFYYLAEAKSLEDHLAKQRRPTKAAQDIVKEMRAAARKRLGETYTAMTGNPRP